MLYPIDDKGRTYSYTLHRMVKLTPNMAALVRALNQYGYIDPIRDGRRGASGTIVALMDRGILREQRPHRRSYSGCHFPATTPEQVWDEAHAMEGDDTPEPLPAPAPRSFIDGGATCQRAENADFDDPHRRHLLRQGDACDLPTPAPTPTDMPCMAMTSDRRTRTGFRAAQGHDHLLATGPECNDAWPTSAPAPTLADDVAALLTEYGTLCALVATVADPRASIEPFDKALAIKRQILDRIAARAPQRAVDPDSGAHLYQHDCGHIQGDGGVPTHCHACTAEVRPWRALYVEPDGAQ